MNIGKIPNTVIPECLNRESRTGETKAFMNLRSWIPAFAGMTTIAIFNFLFSPSIFAASDAGTTSSPFLKIPVSARAAALGGSFAAIAGDITSLDYNPAGLAGINRTDVRATYIDYIQDTTLQSLSVGFPVSIRPTPTLEKIEDAGFSQDRLAFGLEYRVFRAKDEVRNSVGIKGGEFDVRDQLIAVGMAYPILPRLSFGFCGKMIGNKVQDKSVSNHGFDSGLLAKLSQHWSIGASVQNAGSSKALEQVADPLPTLVLGGVAYQTPQVLLLADVSQGRDKVTRASGGIEWSLNRILKLRGGVFHDTAVQLSGGLGIQFTGPQKVSPPLQQRPPASSKTMVPAVNSPTPSIMTQEIVSQIAGRLTSRLKATTPGNEKLKLALLPLNSKSDAGPVISGLLTHQFAQKNEFTLVDSAAVNQILLEQHLKTSDVIDSATAAQIGKVLAAEFVLVGTVDQVDEKYAIGTRLVQTSEPEILATDYAEIAVEDFNQKPKHTLGSLPSKKSSSSFGKTGPSNIDIGLDYGLTSHSDLGITHTVTLRILY